LLAWAPGIKEIWQIEGGCFAFYAEPWFGQDGCKLIAWSDRREAGRYEVITFKARRSTIHYFLVNPWLKSEGNYRLRIVGIRSISITAARSRVPRGRRTSISKGPATPIAWRASECSYSRRFPSAGGEPSWGSGRTRTAPSRFLGFGYVAR
jgi:hypothetical protein